MDDFSCCDRCLALLNVDDEIIDSLSSSVELGSGRRMRFRISRSTDSRYVCVAAVMCLALCRPVSSGSSSALSSPVDDMYDGKADGSRLWPPRARSDAQLHRIKTTRNETSTTSNHRTPKRKPKNNDTKALPIRNRSVPMTSLTPW